ncbi:hypothetical protein DASC09_027640 [Saccharomycopsis crataegensis]|uniref:DUF2470 domain-containing protein n=1 Tax=Saccharomycopsis crataegensis TaxID=43959 RepID=A0AAV5QL45_9ASCO|nr:hypothetical protein DASC09_027640 [Saccharomycopsis crataegensis]
MEQKILAHMNKDHKLALEDYLVVYGDVKMDDKISDIKLKNIEKSQLIISFKHRDVDFEIEKYIPIEPPMENVLSDSRPRLVQMAKDAAAARGFSHVQIKKMVYPNKPANFVLLFLVGNLIFAFFKPTLYYDTFWNGQLGVSSANPVLSFLRKYTSTILYATVVCHLMETMLILRPKLNKYRVPTDIRIEWIIAAFFEGFGAIKRFNTLIPKKH